MESGGVPRPELLWGVVSERLHPLPAADPDPKPLLAGSRERNWALE